MKDTRKPNVAQPQEVTFVLSSAGAGWEEERMNSSCVNNSQVVIVLKDSEILTDERKSDVAVTAEHQQGDSCEWNL